jgi:hypothetical protein
MRNLRSVIVGLALAAFASGVATWSGAAAAQADPAAGDPQLRALLKELTEQFDRGERERLIDPWYLRDLRKVLGRYQNPWDKRLFSDDFSGRGPQPAPPWQITAGEFLIDWRYGLRSVIEAPAPAPAPAPAETQQRGSDRDQMKQLFGQLLQQTLQGRQDQQQQEETVAPAAPRYAAAIAPVEITNAFFLRLDLTARLVPGVAEPRFEFGPYQGANASAGYRLAYTPDARVGTASLELLRLSSRGGIATVEITDQPLDLEDGQSHVIEWSRDRAGRMVVEVDGAQVMEVTDRSYRDPFDGIALVNGGGDYALRSITVDGTSR